MQTVYSLSLLVLAMITGLPLPAICRDASSLKRRGITADYDGDYVPSVQRLVTHLTWRRDQYAAQDGLLPPQCENHRKVKNQCLDTVQGSNRLRDDAARLIARERAGLLTRRIDCDPRPARRRPPPPRLWRLARDRPARGPRPAGPARLRRAPRAARRGARGRAARCVAVRPRGVPSRHGRLGRTSAGGEVGAASPPAAATAACAEDGHRDPVAEKAWSKGRVKVR